jgi:hypothetical protein
MGADLQRCVREFSCAPLERHVPRVCRIHPARRLRPWGLSSAKELADAERIERLLIKARLLIERHAQAVLGVLERWPLLGD